jgi:DNA-binding Lrp family transcriptional regulator
MIWMAQAYVLVNVEAGSEDTVLNQLKALDIVEEAYISYGVYDLVIKVKKDTMEGLKEALIKKIRTIEKVRSTLTLIVVKHSLDKF